jgi:zinc/manganese transport system substrate-binding protein
LLALPASAQTLSVVAAENVYGGVARALAGPWASVASILNNPDQDPHLFEASPSVARALSAARIVVFNGLDYDPWMPKLLGASAAPGRQVIDVAALLHRAPGGNPHLWYDPAAMPALAQALSGALAAADPGHAGDYEARRAAFAGSLAPLNARIAALRGRYAGTPVAATEPVFGLMAAALGLTVRNEAFARAMMNDTEPSPSEIAAFEGDLTQRRVRLLIYNSQASSPAAARLLRIARDAGVPVIGVTETEPEGVDYVPWMLGQLDALDKALGS